MSLYISPTRRMRRMREAMDRMLDTRYVPATSLSPSQVHIPVDVREEPDGFVIHALVPGLSSEDLEIQVLDKTITLRGELGAVAPEETETLLSEIPSGSFRRVFRLPDALDPAKAEATIDKGILRLHVPKAETALPKAIKVKAK